MPGGVARSEMNGAGERPVAAAQQDAARTGPNRPDFRPYSCCSATTMSGLPSALTSPTAAVWKAADEHGFGLPEGAVAVTEHDETGRPSPHQQVQLAVTVEVRHRQGAAHRRSSRIPRREFAPSPLPRSTLTVLSPRLAATRSMRPSLLKSPATAAEAFSPDGVAMTAGLKLSKQRSSSDSRHSREAGGRRRMGRRRVRVEVRDLNVGWIDMRISLVSRIAAKSWIARRRAGDAPPGRGR